MFFKEKQKTKDKILKDLLLNTSASDHELPELDELILKKIKADVRLKLKTEEFTPLGWAASKLLPIMLALMLVLGVWLGVETISINKLQRTTTVQMMQGDEMIDELIVNSALIGDINLSDQFKGDTK